MVQTHPHTQYRIPRSPSRARRTVTFGSRNAKAARRMHADEPTWGASQEERLLQQLRQLASVFPGSRLLQD